MGQYIYLGREERKRLREGMGISNALVTYALNFEKESDLIRKIRYTALKHFGGELRMDLPIEETIHDSNGCMAQRFKNGYRLILDKQSGKTNILDKDNALIKTVSIKTFEELETLQIEVSNY